MDNPLVSILKSLFPVYFRKSYIISYILTIFILVISVAVFDTIRESKSDTYTLAKSYIKSSDFVRSISGDIISISSFPSKVQRNDSIYYFTKVIGSKKTLYLVCAITKNESSEWALAFISEQAGQYNKIEILP